MFAVVTIVLHNLQYVQWYLERQDLPPSHPALHRLEAVGDFTLRHVYRVSATNPGSQ